MGQVRFLFTVEVGYVYGAKCTPCFILYLHCYTQLFMKMWNHTKLANYGGRGLESPLVDVE